MNRRRTKQTDPVIDRAGSHFALWVYGQCRLREIVRRPYAVINNEVRPLTDVVYHAPEALR